MRRGEDLSAEDADEADLHAERYGDLPGSPSASGGQGIGGSEWTCCKPSADTVLACWVADEDELEGEQEEDAGERQEAAAGTAAGYNAVGLSYGEAAEPEEAPEEALYVPRFEVPPDLASLLRGMTETGHKVGRLGQGVCIMPQCCLQGQYFASSVNGVHKPS